MRAILIRVGADGTAGGGGWLAPVDTQSGRFVYIPIPERAAEFHPGCMRCFDEVEAPLAEFLNGHQPAAKPWLRRLKARLGHPMHLDPDYEHPTYGDLGDARGRDLRRFSPGDLVVFYSGLRPIGPADELIYAVVGLYVIHEIVSAISVEDERRAENAHTRKTKRSSADIVVRARPGVSGRCVRCIPIGTRRGSNYFLRPEVEAAWGGLVKADGSPRKSSWLNMSGVPPLLGNPEGFMEWWQSQSVCLVQRNFIA